LKRTIVAWLLAKIDERKAGRIQAPRRAVLVIGQLEAVIACAKCERSTPGKSRVPSFDGVAAAIDRFRITVDAARIAAHIRAHVLV
jgi:hypothetical protein